VSEAEERERYAVEHTTPPDEWVAAARTRTQAMPAPQMAGGEVEVRLLEALVVASGARRVLEIGTFTGVTSLTIAARLPEGGTVTTLEVDPDTAAIARSHFDASPYGDRIELIVGDARETLERLEGPFDLVWIDAWKPDYPGYYDAVVPKLAPRGVIAADNVFLDGRLLGPGADDERAATMRAFVDRVQADPRVHNTVLTVADGILLAWPAAD
jgi:caffeoyl-CoA O-methyltransferase